MLKKTIKFKDFNDIERTKDLYFHVSRTAVLTSSNEAYEEIISIGKQLQERGELLKQFEDVSISEDPFDEKNQLLSESIRMVARLLDRLVDLSYGERSEDGLKFVKNEEVLSNFKNSAAYDAFVEEMLMNQEEMIKFMNNLLAVK